MHDHTESQWEHFDIWNEVPLIPQITGMNCWAAAAAMVVGWRDQIYLEPGAIHGGALPPRAHHDGLGPRDIEALARTWGLYVEPPRVYSIADLRELLQRHGPLWVGQADPDLHVIVITGMHGNGGLDDTWVRVNDPWPIGRGERYSIPFRELTERFRAAEAIAGVHAHILHAGTRRSGSGAGGYSIHRHAERSFQWSRGT